LFYLFERRILINTTRKKLKKDKLSKLGGKLKDLLDELFLNPDTYLEQEIFPEYIKKSRWFSGKNKQITGYSIAKKSVIKVFKHDVILTLNTFKYADGDSETYTLFCACCSGPEANEIQNKHPKSIIFKFKIGTFEGIIYDALYNRNFQLFLLDLITSEKIHAFGDLIITGRKENDFNFVRSYKRLSSKVFKIEQSNTSVIYNNRYFLKIYRKVHTDVNPEVNINRVLTKQGFINTPAFLGAITINDVEEDNQTSLAVLQRFVPNKSDAWTLHLKEIKKYFDKILAKKNKKKPLLPELPDSIINRGFFKSHIKIKDLIGKKCFERVKLLGKRTAEMHLALSRESSDKKFTSKNFTLHDQQSIYKSLKVVISETIKAIKERKKSSSFVEKRLLNNILKSKIKILKYLKNLKTEKIPCLKIRNHGDYHLGQVLFNGKDFFIIDFEGEPGKTVREREIKQTVIKDIAGLCRSFQYCIFYTLYKSELYEKEDIPILEKWGAVWYEYVHRFFVSEYAMRLGNSKLLPNSEKHFFLLFDAFIIDKLFYEINYELNNRPDWAIIPLKGLEYFVKTEI